MRDARKAVAVMTQESTHSLRQVEEMRGWSQSMPAAYAKGRSAMNGLFTYEQQMRSDRRRKQILVYASG